MAEIAPKMGNGEHFQSLHQLSEHGLLNGVLWRGENGALCHHPIHLDFWNGEGALEEVRGGRDEGEQV